MRTLTPGKIALGCAAGIVILLGFASLAHAASSETQPYSPVNFWSGPVTASVTPNLIVSFDLYMSSTTSTTQTGNVGLDLVSCNGQALQMTSRTRHLTNGETLVGGHGGPGATTAMQWLRSMGVPAASNAVKLHLSFISPDPSYFCLNIFDASGLGGPRTDQVSLSIGMK